MNTLTGKIHHVGGIQTFDSGFTKREFVIETADQYPQLVKMELLKDATAFVDESMMGENVTASYDLQGREYDGKFYTNVKCWKIERHD